jgi:hypothetical protein
MPMKVGVVTVEKSQQVLWSFISLIDSRFIQVYTSSKLVQEFPKSTTELSGSRNDTNVWIIKFHFNESALNSMSFSKLHPKLPYQKHLQLILHIKIDRKK